MLYQLSSLGTNGQALVQRSLFLDSIILRVVACIAITNGTPRAASERHVDAPVVARIDRVTSRRSQLPPCTAVWVVTVNVLEPDVTNWVEMTIACGSASSQRPKQKGYTQRLR
jgi:hypothetical protein